jgi:eukaryotic-like serine/threonine-protein kinase
VTRVEIKLPSSRFWYDPTAPLAPKGGFGQVFIGWTEGFEEIAVKRLHITATDSAHRELNIAASFKKRNLGHVMSVIDAGEDSESGLYFVVMPRAERSLQDKIDTDGPSIPKEAASILGQIAFGLEEVKELIHRDLKPANILYHAGSWKIADFGIAKWVEETTSAATLKRCLSPFYASPEQWEGHTATSASDIYALGCIAYCLMTGKPPFINNPEHQHLFEPVPDLVCSDTRLIALTNHMLRKLPTVRPSLTRVIGILESVVSKDLPTSASHPETNLARVSASVASERHKEAARQASLQRAVEERHRVASEAMNELKGIRTRLVERILRSSPDVNVMSTPEYVSQVELGLAVLTVSGPDNNKPFPEGMFADANWDIFIAGFINVRQKPPNPYGWSATLWFGKTDVGPDLRWYEVGYYKPAMSRQRPEIEPFSTPNVESAVMARLGTQAHCSVAYGPYAIDGENEQEFHLRMISLLARAAEGTLSRPHMPFGPWPYSLQ